MGKISQMFVLSRNQSHGVSTNPTDGIQRSWWLGVSGLWFGCFYWRVVDIVAVGYGGNLLLFFANQPVDGIVHYSAGVSKVGSIVKKSHQGVGNNQILDLHDNVPERGRKHVLLV
jgi:hypothetical protein